MFVMPFSSFWISFGLYPSVIVSDVLLSKSFVRKFKVFDRQLSESFVFWLIWVHSSASCVVGDVR